MQSIQRRRACGIAFIVFYPNRSVVAVFIAGGHGAASEPRYRRYCGICISFPQSPAGQPRAVYLPRYIAASQRAKGKGFDTEVGVGGWWWWWWGDRMSLCALAAWGDMEAFQMQLKGPPGVKRLFVITSYRLKACRAPAPHINN